MFPFLQTNLKTKEKHATFDIGSQDNRRGLAVEKMILLTDQTLLNYFEMKLKAKISWKCLNQKL